MGSNLILNLLSKALPIGALMQGLSSVSPKMQGFIKSSLAAGYGANEIVSYLREKFGSQSSVSKNDHLRPDEEAALNRKEKEALPADLAQGALTGAAALGTGSLVARAIPAATKALSKATQKASNATKGPVKAKEKPPTLREKIIQDADKMEQTPNASVYDPLASLKKKESQLAKYIEKEAMSGGDSAYISRKIRSIKALNGPVKRVENEVGQPFEHFLDQILGGKKKATPSTNGSVSDADLIAALNNVLKM